MGDTTIAAQGGTVSPASEQQRFRRRGVVRAHRMTQAREWFTSKGDRLLGEPGDWWVTGADGAGRSVKDAQFRASYEHLEGDQYRRIGTFLARQATRRETIETLEGPATAEAGMWVVTGSEGDSWPVPDEEFRRNYEPVG